VVETAMQCTVKPAKKLLLFLVKPMSSYTYSKILNGISKENSYKNLIVSSSFAQVKFDHNQATAVHQKQKIDIDRV
jgi:hypothetical protein